jgi:hypothetical protein
MKKTIFSAAVLLSAALISGKGYAQDNKDQRDLAAAQSSNANTSAIASAGAPLAHAAAASAISHRAIKDFRSRFTKVADEQWSRMDKGFCAFFSKDGFKVRAYYNARGDWQGSLKYCNEFQLPHAIRDIVKRTYYDLSITSVTIVEIPDHIAYLMNLEDSTTLKVVRVNEDGEMDVLKDFTKSN